MPLCIVGIKMAIAKKDTQEKIILSSFLLKATKAWRQLQGSKIFLHVLADIHAHVLTFFGCCVHGIADEREQISEF